MTAHATTPALIGLDWGTTSLRAYLFDADGSVLDTRAFAAGVMSLPGAAGASPSQAFDAAFEHACGAWLDRTPHVPALASGMVGSAQGWREAPYVTMPADADAFASSLVRLRTARGSALAIVPGALEPGELPDVMRGEETQIVGTLAAEPLLAHERAGALIGLPGTHAKWAWVRDGRIEWFRTYMTGELFAALRGHTILGRTMQPSDAPDWAAFVRGVRIARRKRSEGLLATLFSTRTLGLTGQLAPQAQGDYLSGLLIGHELNALDALLDSHRASLAALAPRLVGDGALCDRYRRALAEFDCGDARIVERASERGLWRIATQAGLVGAAGGAVCAPQ
ncbi:2-dehydro-3-deoxygalactonokinase [Burkholderia mayonis]|uniref:2-dehydro-3-deoxygalactonokinase n=1 Tax=Burkholderia mayonis TaxID=1385591 RepID=A0A1B4FYT1_9BURK|nr:2-dehydro-3-deoxygalactonokinase [Burkholderia mayonis]AOJ08830.1 2-dehydro-3-deoxygalactonokinase [Burkholderia mayonis]KVE56095.1 2-dehydro-3-deoxygalactonokinase [Burkholderia mayonis]